jgi:ribosomal RNA-processing protein 7
MGLFIINEKYLVNNKGFLDWHKTPNTRELKQLVDDTMELFDDEQRQLREEEKSRSLVDEDGFVTVGKSTRRTHTDMNGASVQAIKKEVAEKLKPKDKTLQDFYRFQKREKKRNGKT